MNELELFQVTGRFKGRGGELECRNYMYLKNLTGNLLPDLLKKGSVFYIGAIEVYHVRRTPIAGTVAFSGRYDT